MSSLPSSLAIQPSSKVTVSSFMGLLWGGWALTLPFFAFRIYIRMRTFHRLFWDDFLLLVAWLMLLANAIIWQRVKTGLYLFLDVQRGRHSPPPDFLPKVDEWRRGQLAAGFLLTTSLWCVKMSFLVFFRRLGRNVPRQKMIWWSVLAFVVASYFAVLLSQDWRCLVLPFEVIAQSCSMPVQRATFRAHCAIDVISDAIIVLVPFNILRQVQINLRQKLALAGIFSLTFLIMITAIIRVTVTFPYRTHVDLPWVWTWSSMEETVAIIVACLASFRALFTQQDRSQRIQEVKDISGPITLQGNKAKAAVALRDLYTASTSMDSASNPSPHVNDDTSSDVNLTPCSQQTLVQRDFVVVSNVDCPHEVV